MNRFIGLIITVVAIAALFGAMIGWRWPFQGQNRQAANLDTTQQRQSANRRNLAANQQNSANRRNLAANQQNSANQDTSQSQQGDNINPEATNTSGQSNQNNTDGPVTALW